MRRYLVAVAVCGAVGLLGAQERPVPSDSARITVSGCARNNLFTVRWRDDHETVAGEVAEGRHFRLAGRKEVLKAIKARQASMVEVTGLIRRNALTGPPGISLGGRVRVGIGSPQAPLGDPTRGADLYQPVLDVESYQPLPEACTSSRNRR
jgi:hypothetical protein